MSEPDSNANGNANANANANASANAVAQFESQASTAGTGEDEFKTATIGLKTRDEFLKAKSKHLDGDDDEEEDDDNDDDDDEEEGGEYSNVLSKKKKKKGSKKQREQAREEKRRREEREKNRNEKAKKTKTLLSFGNFGGDEEEEEEEEEEMLRIATKKRKGKAEGGGRSTGSENHSGKEGGRNGFVKNGSAETAVKRPKKDSLAPMVEKLPDKEREEKEAREIEALKEEWKQEQARIKKEKLEVIYSYWDGSGHRRTLQIEKGKTIGEFLEEARKQLVSEFPELRGARAENLLYVKEDIMLPQHVTFYDLIVSKARGKSGPLFNFGIKEDVRLLQDTRIEKDESHPGKICERTWYERNKHIFPASRWEEYDPNKVFETYTVHGGEVNKKKGNKR